ncbi:hypothetical protein [Virgisporangium aurantiacum]|uniref:Two-component system, NarL family, sensor histidine kinase DesK n=1 Tax=Virgisporangium aurantiacum TaxID=175570 RepID=A0A8J3ZC07_9ACTN|nr:hypothetical protein [Virgisporangium aurantiacum]GIJ61186.1 hypothetical protein Vau01_087020 [Virgisporangium aurantiacum]
MPAGSDTALRARPLPDVAVATAPPGTVTGRDPAGDRHPARLAWAPDTRGRRCTLTAPGHSDRMIRLATAAPIAVLAAGLGVQLVLTPVYNSDLTNTLTTLVLMSCYLPMCGYLVWSAAHLRRPRHGGWILAAMTVIIAAGVPLVGSEWQLAFAHLLVSTMIVLPRPWSIVAGGVLLAALVPVDLLVNPRPNPIWTDLVVVQRTAAVLVPTWFAGALRALRAAREDLAGRAVLRERVRIDGELARTVGDSLDTIARRGEATAALAGTDPEAARRELRALVDGSRRTLAAARRLVRSYQRVPLRAELDTALDLLAAAGVPARLVLPAGDLPQYADNEVREALRAAVDRLLRDGSTGTPVITLGAPDGRLRLTVEDPA